MGNKFTGSVVYANNASVKNLTTTSGATVTLYAIWKTTGCAHINSEVTESNYECPFCGGTAWGYDDYCYDCDKYIESYGGCDSCGESW